MTLIWVTLITILGVWLTLRKLLAKGKNLPPGNLGYPLVGETISFLIAQKQDKLEEWKDKRIKEHGSIFKTSLMGFKIAVITGQAGNKFVFSGADNGIASNQLIPAVSIFGRRSIFELSGLRHKLIRTTMSSFLKPENIQRYSTEMDSLVKKQLLQELNGKETVKIVPLLKKTTFKITCSILFGLPEGKEKDELFKDFTIALKGLWSVPFNFPGTKYRKAMQARGRIAKLFTHMIAERKRELANGKSTCDEDIISCFVALRDEDGNPLLEEEIIDNLITVMIASHDTTTIVLSLLIRKLSRDVDVCNKVLQAPKEQEEILKVSEGKLGWRELQMMKYTWNVAQEIMRVTPPVTGNFKLAFRDTVFNGFDIPKGWQILWVASSTQMDSEIFDDPDKFDPLRFEANSKTLIPPYTYIPFGAGPSICPGAEFAKTEMLMVIHHLITNYSWTEAVENEPIAHDPLPYPALGCPLKLYPR